MNVSTLRIKTKKVSDLTKEEYAACRSLNMRQEGTMQEDLRDARNGFREGYVVMAWQAKTLVGWALIFKTKSYGFGYNGARTSTEVNFYVRKSFRRQGIGTLLKKEIDKQKFGKMIVHPWDEVSGKFFEKFDGRKYTLDWW